MFYRSTKVVLPVTVCGLAKWGNYTHKSRLELLMFNKTTKDE